MTNDEGREIVTYVGYEGTSITVDTKATAEATGTPLELAR